MVQKRPISLLVDTGSAITIIHERVWCPPQSGLRKVNRPVLAANGGPLSILGQTEVRIVIAGKEFSHQVLIAGDITQECILGADFLTTHGFVIDLGNHVLRVGETSTPLLSSKTPLASSYHVSVGETFVVHPGEERLCKANISCEYPSLAGTTGVVEAQEGIEEKHQILLARVLANPDQGTVPLRIANLSGSAVTLYKGTNLAKFCPLGSPDQDTEYVELPMTESTPDTHVHHVGLQQSPASLLGIDTREWSEHQVEALNGLVSDFSSVFSSGKSDLGRTDKIYHQINTGEAAPICQTPRRLPFHSRQQVAEMLEEMERQGVIESSSSPWASPIVLVKKKDGSLRFCVDYRKLNKVTTRDSYPLPRVDDILDSLHGAEWFTTLDLRSGYWQVEVEPSDRPKTAFTTPYGLYQFRVMPFGLCNAPSTFQRLMELVLSGMCWEICLIYLDDVIVFGRNWDEHLQRLRQVLSRLQEAHLKLHPGKCQFFRKSVSFLGHIISQHGVETDPVKIQAITHWPPPTNAKELRSFLGLASYYRRFIPKFAEIAAPLYRLQEKESRFSWTEPCQTAFDTLKQKLTTAPVLAFPTRDGMFVLDTDASNIAIGAVLSQLQGGVEKVIAYGSRTLSKSERNYCATRRELLALVYFLRYFRAYLLGRPFHARTDHAALQWLQQFKEPEGQVARWLEQIQEFDFQTLHRPGKLHTNADALSRIVPSQETDATAAVSMDPIDTSNWAPVWTDEDLQHQQANDPDLKIILEWMKTSSERPALVQVSGKGSIVRSLWAQWDRLELRDNVLYRRWEDNVGNVTMFQFVVPQVLVDDVLHALHGGIGGGHLGITKTLRKIRERFYWPGLQKDVEDWCRKCARCAQAKSPSTSARAPLVPSVVGVPMERVALDIIGPLPKSRRGNKYVLVISDYFTRWAEAVSLPNQEASTVAQALMNEWICRYGAPESIHTDQGRNFESKLFSELCDLLDIHKTRTTPYHPQSDGLVERLNRTLRQLLTIQMQKCPEDTWDDHLAPLMLAYRSSIHDSVKFTPHYLMFGREVRLPVDIMFGGERAPGESPAEYTSNVRSRFSRAYETARDNGQGAQKRQKDHYDRKVTGGRYKPGDLVWLYCPAISPGKAKKFHSGWKGPYKILKVISDVVYRIQLVTPPTDRRRRQRLVVHFNRLKPCYTSSPGNPTEKSPSQPNPPSAGTPTIDPPVEDDLMVPIPIDEPTSQVANPDTNPTSQATTSDADAASEAVSPDQAADQEAGTRGGSWSGQLRRTVRPPDYYRPGSS